MSPVGHHKFEHIIHLIYAKIKSKMTGYHWCCKNLINTSLSGEVWYYYKDDKMLKIDQFKRYAGR